MRERLTRRSSHLWFPFALILACGCGSDGDGQASATAPDDTVMDLTNAILTRVSTDCSDYADTYMSTVRDINRDLGRRHLFIFTRDRLCC